MDKNTCRIPNTHKRLIEIHRLLHQCQENYFDPDGFRTNLNATIQAIRNLTFALQNEKEKIPEFDVWYQNWQDKMKEDEILRWLNKSRVKIVHQKDLETKSIIKITIKNYLDVFKLELTLPPFIPSEIIGSKCVKLLSEKYPNEKIKECFAVVERKWIESELSNWELLDALVYGFKFLYQLVIEAHEKTECKIDNCNIKDSLHHLSEEEILTGQYNCANTQQTIRSETITLSDFETVSFGMKEIQFQKEIAKKAMSRYKINGSIFSFEGDLLEYAKMCNELAKKVLVKDKYHRRMFMLHSSSNKWELIDAEVIDKTGKFMLMSELAKLVKRKGVDALIHISEAWVSGDVDSIAKGVSVSETKDKREVLIVTLLTKNKEEINFSTFFKRGLFGNIILSETVVSSSDRSMYLEPIRKIWEEN
jgi:hypothetical protein